MLLETATFYLTLLVFTVDELCNISNKCQHPNDLAKYHYFTKGTLYPSFILKKD